VPVKGPARPRLCLGLQVHPLRGVQAENLAFLLRLGVVVAEQVQHPVHGEQVQLVGQRVAGRAG
jgi:hypothetical protein